MVTHWLPIVNEDSVIIVYFLRVILGGCQLVNLQGEIPLVVPMLVEEDICVIRIV